MLQDLKLGPPLCALNIMKKTTFSCILKKRVLHCSILGPSFFRIKQYMVLHWKFLFLKWTCPMHCDLFMNLAEEWSATGSNIGTISLFLLWIFVNMYHCVFNNCWEKCNFVAMFIIYICMYIRERRDNGLFDTLVPKVW